MTNRKIIKNRLRSLANKLFKVREVSRTDHGRHHATLIVVLGSVHGNKHRQIKIFEGFAYGDDGLRGKDIVSQINRHDVFVACDCPVRTKVRVLDVVNRTLFTQTRKPRQFLASLKQERVRWIEIIEWLGVGIAIDLISGEIIYVVVEALWHR